MSIPNPVDAGGGKYHVWTRGDRLRVARESLGSGMTQAAFAELIGVGRNTVSRYESFADDVKVKPSTIKLWALATGFDREWIETGKIPTGGGDVDASSTKWEATVHVLRPAVSRRAA